MALTSPPLISFLGAWLSRLRGSRFFYWVMDLNPDEAIAAGWLRRRGSAAKCLEWMSQFSLKHARRIIALDVFMRDRILAKGISRNKIIVLPPWSHGSEVRFDAEGRQRFRQAHGLEDKFVVMYSGNHSPCHPLDTLMAAAHKLGSDRQIIFCFIGGGSEWRKINRQILERKAPGLRDSTGQPTASLLCLPYQPLNKLSASLSVADLQVVMMGEGFVGLVHPCKIYNILSVGAPVLYIGPRRSHVSQILESVNGEHLWGAAAHGDVERVVKQIKDARDRSISLKRQIPPRIPSSFSRETVLPRLIGELEAV